jgi:hypothetical protein
MTDDQVRVIRAVARLMHETYEAAAKENGWKTQASCQVPFDELPEANRRTMLAVAEAVVNYLIGHGTTRINHLASC